MSALEAAVVGAGIIGRTHVGNSDRADGLALVGFDDPLPAAAEFATSSNVPLFAADASQYFADLRRRIEAAQAEPAE